MGEVTSPGYRGVVQFRRQPPLTTGQSCLLLSYQGN
jgi:hypothetical protein